MTEIQRLIKETLHDIQEEVTRRLNNQDQIIVDCLQNQTNMQVF